MGGYTKPHICQARASPPTITRTITRHRQATLLGSGAQNHTYSERAHHYKQQPFNNPPQTGHIAWEGAQNHTYSRRTHHHRQ